MKEATPASAPPLQLLPMKVRGSHWAVCPASCHGQGWHGSVGREGAHTASALTDLSQGPGLPVSSARIEGDGAPSLTLGAASRLGCWGGDQSRKGPGWSRDLSPPGPKASPVHSNAGIRPPPATADLPLPSHFPRPSQMSPPETLS